VGEALIHLGAVNLTALGQRTKAATGTDCRTNKRVCVQTFAIDGDRGNGVDAVGV